MYELKFLVPDLKIKRAVVHRKQRPSVLQWGSKVTEIILPL